MISPWSSPVYASMARLKQDGLLEQAKEAVIQEAEASLKRVHGDNPFPRIDYYNALDLAAEKWLQKNSQLSAL